MRSTIALVVAAGSGSRAGGELPKQYRPLAGKAVLAHAVDQLLAAGLDDIQVVIGPDQDDAYRAAIGDRPLPAPITGGATRRDSVRRGLIAIAGAERVLIHDAARPFLPPVTAARLIAALDAHDGAVPVLPVTDTLIRTDGTNVDRDGLARVQTPQAFRYDGIRAAHEHWTGDEPTDDAQVARAAGLDIVQVAGDPALEKLTYEADFKRAEAGLLAPRVGMGIDVHAFASGRPLWLGGVEIPHDKGLAGHSDADVVLHALTDAILGALGAGDIGDHFPPSDPQWRGAPSHLFLDHVRALVAAAGGRIAHADVTIICEAPRIGPYRDAIRARIAAILQVPPTRLSIKATTTERLGFTGRGEGIAAQAVATLQLPEHP